MYQVTITAAHENLIPKIIAWFDCHKDLPQLDETLKKENKLYIETSKRSARLVRAVFPVGLGKVMIDKVED